MARFHVGQRVWEFDENRRIYEKTSAGHRCGPPIYAEHFREAFIVGVEGRSYLVSYEPDGRDAKKEGIAKADARLCDDRDKEDRIWGKSHRASLVDILWRADAATLREVAAVLGYEAR